MLATFRYNLAAADRGRVTDEDGVGRVLPEDNEARLRGASRARLEGYSLPD